MLTLRCPRWLLVLCGLAVMVACSPAGDGLRPAGPVRNVVWIIVDDLGWRDVGAAGSTFYETPNIDRLASQAARFTQFDTASPVCSPTRASFMTGKHPARVQITNWIGGEQDGLLRQADYRRELPLEEVTPGEAFKEAGFVTAYMGKWHLGDGGHLPDAQGFDITVAVNGAGQPARYFWPYHGEEPSIWDVPDLEDGSEGEYLTDRLTDEAVAFLHDHAERPFFLVLSHYAVHTPLQSKDQLTAGYEAKAAALPPLDTPFAPESGRAISKQRQDHPVYAGMVESTDDSVGRILDALDELGLTDSTAVVFVSDNGGLSTLPTGRTSMPTSNVPLRAGKGWLYEGGIRAPLIIKWPGVTDIAGARPQAQATDGARGEGEPTRRGGTAFTIDVAVTSMDLYPTLLDMAGLPQRPQQHVDGVSLAPLLRGAAGVEREALFWHFPHYHGSANRPSGAVRIGDYKLIQWFEDGKVELYDLANDPGEQYDLVEREPQEAARLRDALGSWRVAVDAQMPTPNPDSEVGGR
ncbi:MAG: sulfatase [Acidobacteriota bacterium]